MPNDVQKNPTVLIVDDEPDFVTLIETFLKYMGFETRVAYEGAQAVEIAKKTPPDLILLDLQLPAGSGQWVLTNLRSHPITRKIPIIILTGMQNSEVQQETEIRGAQAFMRKPFDNGDLLSKIHSLLNKSK